MATNFLHSCSPCIVHSSCQQSQVHCLTSCVVLQCKGNCIKDHAGSADHGAYWYMLVLHSHQCLARRDVASATQTEGEVHPHSSSFVHLVAGSACHQLQVCTIIAAHPLHQYCLGELCSLSNIYTQGHESDFWNSTSLACV